MRILARYSVRSVHSSSRYYSVTAQSATSVHKTTTTEGTDGWPPGLHVFERFGDPSHELSRHVVENARNLIDAVQSSHRAEEGEARDTHIPQPERGRVSQAHNLKQERKYIPLRVADPLEGGILRCEHFEEYGSSSHALTYFRGNENMPRAVDPILDALREVDVVKSLSPTRKSTRKDVDALGLQWKLTLNSYKARTDKDEVSLKEAGGALFPWHTDLPANGEITAIATLFAPAILEFSPYPDAEGDPTRIIAKPGSLVLLSGPARWEWVHRAVPHPDAAGKERISLVFGCAPLLSSK